MENGHESRQIFADIVVYGPGDDPTLVVEVKAISGVSAEWAARWRRNLMVHGGLATFPRCLLAFPDTFYLWSRPTPPTYDSLPDYTVAASDILAPYVDASGLSLPRLTGSGLEFAVFSWLQDLTQSELTRETAGQHLRWLFDSGLYAAIRGGYIKSPVAV